MFVVLKLLTNIKNAVPETFKIKTFETRDEQIQLLSL